MPLDPTRSQHNWRRFCRFLTSVFYRKLEVTGLENLPTEGPVILCANHVNALADAVVVQAALPRIAHPIARSGLFRRPFLRPILKWIQAVPIARRRPGADPNRNQEAFEQCHRILEQGSMLLIFPEGQSHSDPSLRPVKTGAARLVLGQLQRSGHPPTVLPVGLLFPDKGRFRSSALVQVGEPVDLETDLEGEEAVKELTERVRHGLATVTLNADSWHDVALMRTLDDFFDLEKYRATQRKLSALETLQRLATIQRWFQLRDPDRMKALRRKLERFARLCRRHGVRSHHLEIRYSPWLVTRFVVRSLTFILLVFPIALWGLIHSGIPWFATWFASGRAARGRDQYDSAGMLFGLLFFAIFWGAQTTAVWWWLGTRAALFYGLSLPLTALVALAVGRERRRILDEVRIFLVFLRRSELRRVLRERRDDLERDVAAMSAQVRTELGEDGLAELARLRSPDPSIPEPPTF